jgi:hypothetical protein
MCEARSALSRRKTKSDRTNASVPARTSVFPLTRRKLGSPPTTQLDLQLDLAFIGIALAVEPNPQEFKKIGRKPQAL